MSKKYKLTKEKNARGLRRIRALRDIPRYGVVKGDLGGWVESEDNLSQEGDCWVSCNSKVFGKAKVYGSARVLDNAWVFDNAEVSENAHVSGNAKISENARVVGNAHVSGNAKVYGNARVTRILC